MSPIQHSNYAQNVDQVRRYNTAPAEVTSLNNMMKQAVRTEKPEITTPVENDDLSIPDEAFYKYADMVKRILDNPPTTQKELLTLLKNISSEDGKPYFKTTEDQINALSHLITQLEENGDPTLVGLAKNSFSQLVGLHMVMESIKWKLVEDMGKPPAWEEQY